MNVINSISKWITKILSIMLVVIFGAITIIYFMQVFVRYVLNMGFTWTEEISRYGMIWLIFLGVGWIVLNDEHIKVSVIEDALKGVPQNVLRIIQDIFCLAFAVMVFIFSFSQLKICSLSVSANTGISNIVPYIVIPIGMVVRAWGYIARLITWFVDPKSMAKKKDGPSAGEETKDGEETTPALSASETKDAGMAAEGGKTQ